jgi:hypothetical protein
MGTFIAKITKNISKVGLYLHGSGRYTETEIKVPAKEKE